MFKSKLLFLLILFNACGQNKDATIIGDVKTIDFSGPYKFNEDIEEKLKNDSQPWKHQNALVEYANKGEFQKALELYDFVSEKKATIPFSAEQIDSIKSNFTLIDASAIITSQAKSTQVVIINEAHHNPSHRIFTRSILQELFNDGYHYLGLEALFNGPKGGTPFGDNGHLSDERDTLINDRKYPFLKSISYTEPQMGNLIREALKIGFIVFPYEKPGVGSGKPREVGQAKNIQQILDKNPKAKILIHCGFAHAYEGDYQPWEKAMAGWLKELSGIDPLTINQVTFSEFSKTTYNSPLLNIYSFDKPKVLVNSKGRPMKISEGRAFTDIAVIHPITKYINDRPEWLFQNGFKNVVIDISDLNIGFPVMVYAYNQKEDISKAIPIDVLEIKDTRPFAQLALPEGKFKIVVANKEGEARKIDVLIK